MLQKKLADTHYAQILEKVEAQTDRVARIIKNLLTFARSPSDASFQRVDLKESLEEILSLIDYKLKNMNIRLALELEPVPPLYAQGERLQQVFINIILNALDAMPQGGEPEDRADPGERRRGRPRLGHRDGHQARAPLPHLRPFLHDEGGRQGDGTRPVHQLRHRQGARRPHPGPERGRPGFHVHDHPAGGPGRLPEPEIPGRQDMNHEQQRHHPHHRRRTRHPRRPRPSS